MPAQNEPAPDSKMTSCVWPSTSAQSDWKIETINGAEIKVLRNDQLRRVLTDPSTPATAPRENPFFRRIREAMSTF